MLYSVELRDRAVFVWRCKGTVFFCIDKFFRSVFYNFFIQPATKNSFSFSLWILPRLKAWEYLRLCDWRKSFVGDIELPYYLESLCALFFCLLRKLLFPYNWRNNIPKEHWLWKNVYICDVDGEKSIDARKHFVLSPNWNSPNFIWGTEAINAHSVLYIPAMRVLRIAYVYVHGVGILFLHSSSHKAFGDAPVHGRKTTSLTSFLFLYPY